MSRRSWVTTILAVTVTLLAARAQAPHGPLVLLVAGLTQDYLEPCGCGGQNAGGLARRVAMIQAAAADHPGAVVIDLGDHGHQEPRRPVIFRALARAGVAASGLSEADLLQYAPIAAAAARSGVPLTSLPPPAGREAPPTVQIVEAPGGRKLALVSVAYSTWPSAKLAEACRRSCTALAERDDLALVMLASHLGFAGTTEVLEQLPERVRPKLILLATDNDDSLPAFEKLGATWIPVARRGRSLSVVTIRGSRAEPAIVSDQLMVLPGTVDPVVQSWIDTYFEAERAGLAAEGSAELPEDARPESCAGCHADAVKAWRAHPHGHAVETLEQTGRDVASCLGCHSEVFRRQGVKPAAGGDRGVVCATCHDGLAAHRKDPASRAGTIAVADCRGCHTTENSPKWSEAPYLSAIAAACAGEIRAPLQAAEGDQP